MNDSPEPFYCIHCTTTPPSDPQPTSITPISSDTLSPPTSSQPTPTTSETLSNHSDHLNYSFLNDSTESNSTADTFYSLNSEAISVELLTFI